MSRYVEIVEDSDVTKWHYVDPETNVRYDSEFQLRIVPTSLQRTWRRKHTTTKFVRGQQVEEFDFMGFADRALDFSILGWSGVKRRGEELDCTTENKLKLPEQIKAEIIRLCVGKELGQIQQGLIGHDDEEPSNLQEVLQEAASKKL